MKQKKNTIATTKIKNLENKNRASNILAKISIPCENQAVPNFFLKPMQCEPLCDKS